MKKKLLLPFLFALQTLGSISTATASTMNNVDAVTTESQLQKNGVYDPYFIGEATLRSLATATGTTTGRTIDPLNPTAPAKIGPHAPLSAFVVETLNNVNALKSSILLPLKQTMAVDNLMHSVFSYTAVSGSLKFCGDSGSTLSSGDSSSLYTEYTITGGALVSTLFLTSGKPTSNIAILTPAEKLSIFLRAVFGINGDTFEKLTFPTSSEYFGASWSDQLDSGTMLTAIFDVVLGRNGTTAITAFSGGGIFNRINTTNGTTNLTGFGGKTSTTSTDLTSPTDYFQFVLGTNSTDPKYDLARLRALIQDLIAS